MQPKTILVDFAPHITKETPSQLQKRAYYEEILAGYDLGEVITCSRIEFPNIAAQHGPDVIIATSKYEAQELKDICPEADVYVVSSIGSIFGRKAERDEKIQENEKVFRDVEETIKKLREATEEERVKHRKLASMSYSDVYDTFIKALISDDKEVREQVWDVFWGPGEKHPNIIWMRVQMMAEVWEGSKGEQLEQLMLMSMERHIDFGLARKIENFTDEDGQEYHQYVYIDPYGNDMEYVRKLPRASKDQERYSYEALLEKNDLPKNYLRVQMEANQFKKEVDEYREAERVKILAVLESYAKNPKMGRKELGVASEPEKEKKPLLKKEVIYLREILKRLESLQNTN